MYPGNNYHDWVEQCQSEVNQDEIDKWTDLTLLFEPDTFDFFHQRTDIVDFEHKRIVLRLNHHMLRQLFAVVNKNVNKENRKL